MQLFTLFKSFYAKNQIPVDSIFQREFGIGVDKKINYRHRAFSNQREFQTFLASEGPRFISHSVGRFEFPWATPMERKILLSADLVFDIDAKPEEGHNSIFCNACVEKAKSDVVKLLEEFLFPQFGLRDKSEVLVVFSGSKGFHVHVRCNAVQQLSSTSRRLLVDYITGKELALDSLLNREMFENRVSALRGPSTSSVGWQKHFLETALSALDNLALFSKKKGTYLRENKSSVVELLARGNWDFFHYCEPALQFILSETIAKYGVQVDSPVTFDVHRLIRVPGTLHGDTGFVAKPLSIAELASFDPTRHAAAFKGTCKTTLAEPASLVFNGENFELKKGDNDVPLSLAVLLSCKGLSL